MKRRRLEVFSRGAESQTLPERLLLAAVALAVDLDDRAVVHQPIHRRHGHGAGRKHVLPLAERLAAGHQKGLMLVAVHDQF